MITCHLFDGPTGDQILDLTPYVRTCPIARGAHGDADTALTLDLSSLSQQLALLERYGVPWLEVHDVTGCIWAGRLEDMQAASSGQPALTAYGPWRALDDVRLTALWSDTRTAAWAPMLDTFASFGGTNLRPARFAYETDNQLYFTLPKGTAYAALDLGALYYDAPSGGSRDILNVTFDYEVLLPAGWFAVVGSSDRNNGTYTTEWALGASGATQRGSICAAFGAAKPRIIAAAQAAAGTPAGETGTWFMRLTNIRATTISISVNTTLTANALLGATTIFVAVGTNIVVGQSLYLGGANPERVTVSSVAGLTIGITPLAAAKTAGDTVRAQRVLVSDIASAVAATVAALNPSQMQTSTQLIQASTVDRRDVILQDQPATTALEALAADEQLSVGVSRERMLWLRPRDQPAWSQTFAVDAASLQVGRTIEQLRNQIVGVYTDPDGRPLRTTAATAAQSVARWGLTRQAALEVQTTSVAQAEALRDLALADSDDPPAQAAIAFTQLWTLDGAAAPLTALAPGDTLLIRNLPLGTAADIDDLSVVRVARTVLDPLADDRAAVLTVELENPPAELEVALSRIALFYEPPAPQGLDKPLRIT